MAAGKAIINRKVTFLIVLLMKWTCVVRESVFGHHFVVREMCRSPAIPLSKIADISPFLRPAARNVQD